MAFKNASDNAQARASRILLRHSGGHFEDLNLKEQRKNLTLKTQELQRQLSELKKEHQTSGVVNQREAIKLEERFLVEQIKTINAKLNYSNGVNPMNYIQDILKERVTLAEYNSIMDEAFKRARQAESNAVDTIPEYLCKGISSDE